MESGMAIDDASLPLPHVKKASIRLDSEFIPYVPGGGTHRAVQGVYAMAPKAAAGKKLAATEKALPEKAPAEKKLSKDASAAGVDKKKKRHKESVETYKIYIFKVFLPSEIQPAVRLVLPGELGKHAVRLVLPSA
ncbi:hypothetical protein L6452_01261 [Arctium lappa]|uniref:Uncharacterized protein n=1 Tax=Arctium lappa TaxID=4217 RepID=A0ACB9FFM7_ARCLA|nr:hypothetical protein L6452_01261 [Arctium lappa]